MKKRFVIILCMSVILITCWGCGSGNSKVDQTLKNQAKQSDDSEESDTSEESDASQQSDVSEQSADGGDATGTEGIDVDLTRLSSTMVYSEVYNMMTVPEDYIGKKVRMEGQFAIYEDENTGKIYFACIISDATACCQQGIEFELKEDLKYPDDYPELGTDVVITGDFDTYSEGDSQYCILRNAIME